MRDRTKSRNYSPERDEFRREHERHRAWGLTQSHPRKLRRLPGSSTPDYCQILEAARKRRAGAAADPPQQPERGPTSSEATTGKAATPDSAASSVPSPCGERRTDRPEPAGKARSGPCVKAAP